MSEHPIPPGLMLRSFMTVGSAYILVMFVSFILIAYLLGVGFFPEFIRFLELESADQQTMMEVEPTAAIPVAMVFALLALNSLVCCGVGWLVSRTAPFSPFTHGVFVAILIFVNYLQIVIADPAAKKWMDALYMVAFPLAILWGAKWGAGGISAANSVGRDDRVEEDGQQ